jgi:hypothetical protein
MPSTDPGPRWGVLAAVASACAGSFTSPAPAQVAPAEQAPLPPAIQLGLRAESVQRNLGTLSAVVLVPDESSYISAISRWTLTARYPVLIDDGSAAATEDIARFIRAFAPATVYRWSDGDKEAPRRAAIRDPIERAIAHAWQIAADGPDPGADVRARWKEIGLRPAGIVVADDRDAAWTAALALAAGRGQPIVWVDAPVGVSRTMPAPDADALASVIEVACEGLGYPWRVLGDEIDAVTLCVNAPSKIELGADLLAATTDRIGRHGANLSRWAWAGQVTGDGPRAAYNAMCSLFLRTTDSWHFEGYPPGAPWSDFSQARAAETLAGAGIAPAVAGGGAMAWRRAAAAPIRAGLICINSKGTRDFFDLNGDRCSPGDVPFLTHPAAVYFVHSWSANAPANRATVGGRWIERGAYAYFGSVQEPLLQAFVPTPTLAARLAAGAAWGAAVRLDASPLWKLAVHGDPLMTMGDALGPWPARAELPLPLPGAEDVAGALKASLTEGDYAAGARTLVLLGRDEDAARLVLGVLADAPEKFDTALASAALMPLFRTGRTDTMLRAFAGLDAQQRADGGFRDVLWNAFAPTLAVTADAALVALLSDNLREDQLARDAIDLSGAIDRTRGPGKGREFLAAVRQRATDRRDQADLDRALGIEEVRPPRRQPGTRPGTRPGGRPGGR